MKPSSLDCSCAFSCLFVAIEVCASLRLPCEGLYAKCGPIDNERSCLHHLPTAERSYAIEHNTRVDRFPELFSATCGAKSLANG